MPETNPQTGGRFARDPKTGALRPLVEEEPIETEAAPAPPATPKSDEVK